MIDMERKCAEFPDADNEELIGVLTAISVTSKQLARKLIRLSIANQSQKGGMDFETIRSQPSN